MKFSFARFLVLLVVATLLIAQPISAQVVDIPDPNLERAIQEELGIPLEARVTQPELLQLTGLAAAEIGITDLTGLEHATNLGYLDVGGNQIRDIRPLAELINLTGLSLANNPVEDITPLANLINLTSLNLAGNGVESLEPLTGLVQLQRLDLFYNRVKDLTPLASLTALTDLILTHNQVSDLDPLVNLTALKELWLSSNAITDITPLVGLKNLEKLYLADNPIRDFIPLAELEGIELDIEIDFSKLGELNLVVEVPDPNLEQAIREVLSIPDGVPLTQGQMLRFTRLNAGNRGITDLTGLEYATNLEDLSVGGNQIRDISALTNLVHLTGLSLFNNQVQDISPLANLTNLTYLNLALNRIETVEPLARLVQLQILDLFYNRVKDLTPLASLTALTDLILTHNQVGDLTPLASLTALTDLILTHNQVGDLTPLANLVNLERLYIRNNLVADVSPLNGLNLIEFEYDEVCDIVPFLPPVRERIEGRSFPSVFQAWDDVTGLDHLTADQRYTLHDLHFSPFFSLQWQRTLTEPTYGVSTQLAGNVQRASEIRKQRLDINPNMVFLVEIRLHSHFTEEAFPPDSDLWLRDTNNEIVRARGGNPLINFLNPKVQELLVNRIIAVHRCGLYDGIVLDGFHSNGLGFGYQHLYTANDEEIIQAWINVFRSVRLQVHDDFLILINTNRTKPTRYAEFVNGTFMETGTDGEIQGLGPGGYTHNGLAEIESTLLWAEENLRAPQINSLEGWGIPTEPPDSPNNRRWMRVFTTMSLTLSDGYVLYNTGRNLLGDPDHEHLWYPFWDADLGLPVAPKAQQHQNVDGLFIREFTNGWAVYNRSGAPQTITLPSSATAVGNGDSRSTTTHLLPDLDGEIYLKTKNPADVNGDWVVNILDLVFVANGFGKSTPDPNGDGVVNILDLVFVAQALSQ